MIDLPPTTRFTLGDALTDPQRQFFDHYGFLHFEGFASSDEVQRLRESMTEVQSQLLRERRGYVNGIPIRYGKDVDGSDMVQRFAFTSQFSDVFRQFVRDDRFRPIMQLIGDDCRVGENEKDGVVVNHYVNAAGSNYRQLGWHTDGLRDIFLHRRKPGPMLNVGVYLDDSPRENGGLRLIAGSHKQSLARMLFGKFHFLDNRVDPREMCVEAKAGDLTIHDGRLWHRVARSTVSGEASRRRIMYVPFINGPYEPKHARSPVPISHRLGRLVG